MNAMPFRIEYRVQFDMHDSAPDEHWRDESAGDDSLEDAEWRIGILSAEDKTTAFRIVERVIFEKVVS